MQEPEAIAKEAYARIQDGESVFLDGGTLILRQLASMLANGGKRRTLVCTNALPIAYRFRHAEDIQLIFIGGQLWHAGLSCLGRVARQMLEPLSFDKCFLSVRYFSMERGFSTDSLQEAEVKRTLLATSRESYFLMDSSVYGNDALSLISPCEPGKRLITDWRIPAKVVARLEATGLQVILASAAESPADL
jgi:DeoR family fructose operon transcriptional repressor